MIYEFKMKDIDGKITDLSNYKGKVLLVVNTATKCGFTPQYEGLEKLYQTYHDKGFEILDFPCNQFMHQAPGDNDEIKSFCDLNYHVSFKQFSKIEVNGKNAHPLYQYLKVDAPREENGEGKKTGFLSHIIFGKKIKWNFTKFLIDDKGQILYRFSPQVKPEQIENKLKTLLNI